MPVANDLDPLIGQLVGPWRLEARIGQGGLASVYRATHTRVGAKAAIKVLIDELAGDSEWIERMLVEAQLVNKAGSEHIVKIIDLLATSDRRPALVMELLEGAPLSKVLDAGVPPAGSLLVVVLDVLEALAAAHRAGIIHRDLKPSNIFVSPDGRGTLLDFGIAKLVVEGAAGIRAIKTEAGTRLGTPRYMAPEQLRGDAVGPETDLYAVGEVLFEALSGAAPYGDATGDELVRQKLVAPAQPLEALRGDLPPSLARLVARALAVSPHDRFRSAEELGRALRAVLAELPETAFEPLPLPGPEGGAGAQAEALVGEPPPTVKGQKEAATRDGRKPTLGVVGPYRLEAVLGEGGAGKVYRAYDPRLRRHVALKVFHPASGPSAERFLLEARAHARLNHPNVCRIFDIGEADGSPYLAMQLLSGKTLVEAAQTLDVRQRVGLIVETGRALQAVHSLGLVHRDVKPANVLVEVDPQGTPHAFLTDFGLVRTVGEVGLTTSGTIVGTPRYMAPEQLAGNGANVDARTDVYALGATLYEILAGRPVFDGSTSVELMFQIATQEPVPLQRVVPTLPRDLETIVDKCLRKRPADRYSSTGELVDDLEHWLRDEPIAARPPALTERLRRAARRHRALFAAVGVALVLGGGGASFELVRWQQAQREAAIVDDASRDAALARQRLRGGYLLPLHDLKSERAQVEAVIAELAAQAGRGSSRLRARLLLEQGGLELELGEVARARRTLDAAAQLAPDEPEIQRRYGEALLRLYVAQMGELDVHSDLEGVARKRALLAANERAAGRAAQTRARQARSAGGEARNLEDDEARLLDGRLLLAEQQFDAAIAVARELLAARPLWAEAALLEAEALSLRGTFRISTSNVVEARSDFVTARQRYQAALAIARSHPDGWLQLCSLTASLAHEAVAEGREPRKELDDARQACAAARLTMPSLRRPIASELWALSHAADYAADHGQEWKAIYEEAERLFASAGELGKTSSMALHAMVSLNTARADEASVHGVDPTPFLDRALRLVDGAERLAPVTAPDEEARGGLLGRLAVWEAKQGRSPVATHERAIAANLRAIKLDPFAYQAYGNIATSGMLLVEYELAFGRIRDQVLDQGMAAAFALSVLHAGRALGHQRFGETLWYRMKAEWLRGRDPSTLLALVDWELSEALRYKPDVAYSLLNRAEAVRLVAEYQMRHQGAHALGARIDAAQLRRARADLDAAINIDPRDPMVLAYIARFERLLAEVEPAAWQAHLAAADEAVAKALAVDGKDVDALELGAELALARLPHVPRADRKARRSLVERGLALAERSLAIRQGWPRTRAIEGRLTEAYAAILREDRAEVRADEQAARAKQRLDAAYAANPTLTVDLGPR